VDLAVWTLIALPGVVLGVVAGVLRFHVDLSPAP
jgi:ABC-2 type transport system permease protein